LVTCWLAQQRASFANQRRSPLAGGTVRRKEGRIAPGQNCTPFTDISLIHLPFARIINYTSFIEKFVSLMGMQIAAIMWLFSAYFRTHLSATMFNGCCNNTRLTPTLGANTNSNTYIRLNALCSSQNIDVI
jgi:hypothetical protein